MRQPVEVLAAGYRSTIGGTGAEPQPATRNETLQAPHKAPKPEASRDLHSKADRANLLPS